jgi:hypothetical protein
MTIRKADLQAPDSEYFRHQAERARRLADAIMDRDVEAELLRMAREYDALADELEAE